MKVLRGTIVGMGLAALLAAAAAAPARSEATRPAAKPAAVKTIDRKVDEPAPGTATGGKATTAKTTTAKATTAKATTAKSAAKPGAAKDAAVAPPRALEGYPANPPFKDWLAKAGTDSFYLVLDPRGGTLKLVLGGVEMRSFEVSDVQVATPRRFGAAKHLPADWHERVWTGAVIDPPHPGARTEIVGPEIGTADAEVLVPPTPEEAIPVPALYRVRFAEGLALEVTGGVAEQKGELPPAELPTGFREKIRQIREGAQDPLRLRIRLTPEAYAEMYRSLPPGTDFIVVHGGK